MGNDDKDWQVKGLHVFRSERKFKPCYMHANHMTEDASERQPKKRYLYVFTPSALSAEHKLADSI